MIELLIQLGFENKPFQGYPDTWWFAGKPILTLSAIKSPADIIRTCLVTYTPEARLFSELSETDRKNIVIEMIKQF